MTTPAYGKDSDGVTRADGVCCGQRIPGTAGDRLVLACKLCAGSPTYWRAPGAEATTAQTINPPADHPTRVAT